MKKISIIIPAYNCERTIEKTINSVLNQSIKNIEIIIIDDGSTDQTSTICKNYQNQINYIKTINQGCSQARNLGIINSTSEYIYFLDSDDWLDSHLLENMYNKATKKKLDIVICGIRKINENFKELSKIHPQINLNTNADYFSSPCNKLYKKSLFKNKDLFFTKDIFCGEDLLFNFKLFTQTSSIGIEKKYFYNYYMNLNSTSNNYKNRIDIYKVLKEMINFSKKYHIYDTMFYEIQDCYKYHGIAYPYDVLQKLKLNNNKDFKNLRKEIELHIKSFKFLENFSIKFYHFYRKFRLKMIFLKKYIKGR